ncbi:hypothetical protein DH2020_022576 [Rehmannia glutinosa]|uniref:Lysine ketoglutarate reductase trans-splicing-like protein n=1 Tax=Rehmannia glutinosa TaxID=99300 RepID=A0ABR0W3I6_REHGL
MGTLHRSGVIKKSNDSVRLILTTIIGMVLGYFIGVSFPSVSLSKINLSSSLISSFDMAFNDDHHTSASRSFPENLGSGSTPLTPKIYAPTNPRGAESLPPGIVVSESDFYLRRLWGEPSEVRNDRFHSRFIILSLDIIAYVIQARFVSVADMTRDSRSLNISFCSLTSYGYMNYDEIYAYDHILELSGSEKEAEFSEDFQIMLFHYDGRTSEWDQFEWSQRAIHVSVRKQTKWWYAKRFLHPDVVAAYDYIFIWDEDLGVEHFNAEKYMELVKKHGLEISQPGLEPNNGLTWQMTKRRGDREVHNFVEIMAPVFSREAWKCVWHMIQNDLVHGWGLDFALRRCVDPAHEKIGVVDSQWIVHQVIPSLGSQGEAENGKAPWQGVRDRCKNEWALFQDRLANADKAYFSQLQHP